MDQHPAGAEVILGLCLSGKDASEELQRFGPYSDIIKNKMLSLRFGHTKTLAISDKTKSISGNVTHNRQ